MVQEILHVSIHYRIPSEMAKKEPAAVAKVVKEMKEPVQKLKSKQLPPSKPTVVTSSVVSPGPATELLQSLFTGNKSSTVSAAKAAVDQVLQNRGTASTGPKASARTVTQPAKTIPSSKSGQSIASFAKPVTPKGFQGTSSMMSSLHSDVMSQLMTNPTAAMASFLQNTVGSSTALVPPTLAPNNMRPEINSVTLPGTGMPVTRLMAPTSLPQNVLTGLPTPHLPHLSSSQLSPLGMTFPSPAEQQIRNATRAPIVIKPTRTHDSTPISARITVPQVRRSTGTIWSLKREHFLSINDS